MSLFIDSGTGLVLSVLFVLALVLNSENNFIIAKLTIWVWCGVVWYGVVWCGVVWCGVADKLLHVYRRLLTNRLHGKAAELCLANS